MVSQSYFRENVWSVSSVVHRYGDFDGNGVGGESRSVDPYHVSHCAGSSCLAGVGFLLSASVWSCVIIFSLRTCIFSHHLVCWINCSVFLDYLFFIFLFIILFLFVFFSRNLPISNMTHLVSIS